MRGSPGTLGPLVAAVAAGLLLYLTAWAAPVVAPLGLGLFLAALAAPLFGRLEARGTSPPVALLVTVGVVLAVGVAIVVLLLVSARTLTDSLAGYATELEPRYADAGVDGTLRGLLPPETLVSVLRSVIGIIGQVASALGFAIVVAALLLLDGPHLARLAEGGLGRRNPLMRELPAVAQAAVTYFLVRIRVNLATAAALLALMLVLGIDDPLLWALGAFFLSFVPYLGLILALIPPTILALAESGPLAALAMVVGGTLLNLVAENVLEPTLTGRALELSTWLVFVMFFVWVWVLGPIGALLSMPITVLLVLLLAHEERTRWIAELVTRRSGLPSSGDPPQPGRGLDPT